MREPAQLVSAILEELRPLRNGVSQDKAKNLVHDQLLVLKIGMPVLDRLSVKKNRNSARQIRNTIHRLQYQIRTAPRPVQNCGYVRPNGPVQTFPNDDAIFSVPEMLSLMDEALDRLATFSAAMDYIKAWCASSAKRIMLQCSKKPPASSSENSPLRVIASLIYQYCTGKQQDLERACEDVLRRGGIGLDEPRGVLVDTAEKEVNRAEQKVQNSRRTVENKKREIENKQREIEKAEQEMQDIQRKIENYKRKIEDNDRKIENIERLLHARKH
jgi:hypothetical protein